MSVLDIKVLRDLWSLRTQVLSIALLIAAGIAILVMSVSNYLALVGAMEAHYRNERFADLFASLERAPLSLAEEIRKLDGAGIVEPRLSATVRVIREDSELAISGRIVSVPEDRQPLLNRLALVEGRWLDPGRSDEVIINAAYARARAIRPGEAIDVILNGRLQRFRIAGTALSPEFVFTTRAGLPLPDDRNFVVIWVGEEAVAGAFDMKGAFNDLVMTLAPDASKSRVIEDVDRLLAPYGGIGAHDRHDLASHRFLEDELAEQETMSIVMPAVFFGIAAFLLNTVLGRLVEAQREQIAALKALGFANGPIVLHYVKLVSAIALAGSIIGVVLGRWLATLVIESYRSFFRFPQLEPYLEPWVVGLALAASLLAANAAAASAVRRVARLTPAEAMRPLVPKTPFALGRLGLPGVDTLPMRHVIALRTIVSRPLRTLLTIVGIALAVPLVLFGLFWFDAISRMIEVSFERIERGDALLVLAGPVEARALHELRALPGVVLAEGQRMVAVRLGNGHRSYRTAISGIAPGSELRVARDADLAPIPVPPDGIMLSRALAGRLGLGVGEDVTVEVLEGSRPVGTVRVATLSDDILGFSATMALGSLNRLLGEGDVINAAALRIDPMEDGTLWRLVQEMPKVEASSVKSLWLTLFNETIAGMLWIGATILAGFGVLIAVGVVYNSARVALQERAWELASLRILGFTRGEVTRLLLSELAIEVAVAIPIGLLIGRGLIGLIVSARARESFQIPVVIAPSSYAIAALVILAAAAASALVIKRRIDRLDLVSVLKTRD